MSSVRFRVVIQILVIVVGGQKCTHWTINTQTANSTVTVIRRPIHGSCVTGPASGHPADRGGTVGVHTAPTRRRRQRPVAVAQRERGELAINTYSTLVAARVPHHLLLVLVVGGHQLLLVLRMHGVHLVQRLDRVGVLQVGQGHLLHGRRVHLLLQRLLLLAAQLLRRLDKVRHASPQTAVVGIICTWMGGREGG